MEKEMRAMGRSKRRRRRRNARRIATSDSVAGLRTGEWGSGNGVSVTYA